VGPDLGHRNDVAGFYQELRALDAWVPRRLERLREDDLIIRTADRDTDPTTPSADPAREAAPVRAFGARVRAATLGERATFADQGATLTDHGGAAAASAGTSFLEARTA